VNEMRLRIGTSFEPTVGPGECFWCGGRFDPAIPDAQSANAIVGAVCGECAPVLKNACGGRPVTLDVDFAKHRPGWVEFPPITIEMVREAAKARDERRRRR
jgi:hypothetical protein